MVDNMKECQGNQKQSGMKRKGQTELTAKQQRFANEYCIDLNATAAYRRAGYNARDNAAEACASRLLSNAKVREAVQKKEKIVAKRCEVTAENILRETGAVAFSDIRRLFMRMARRNPFMSLTMPRQGPSNQLRSARWFRKEKW